MGLRVWVSLEEGLNVPYQLYGVVRPGPAGQSNVVGVSSQVAGHPCAYEF